MAMIFDLHQIVIANLMMSVGRDKRVQIDADLIRHMVLNSIRAHVKKFRREYGPVIIACDSHEYWRRNIFPPYKGARKAVRDKSVLDWNLIHQLLNQVRDELIEWMPYRVVIVPGAEADDVIAVLGRSLVSSEPVLVLSTDKDFCQLHGLGVAQYSPTQKSFIKVTNPAATLKEHIIRGDRGDGVPNILSGDNVFLTGERQKSINTVKLTEWLDQKPEEFCGSNEIMLRGYHRNQQLIDFTFIPQTLQSKILEEYNLQFPNPRQKMLTYFMKFRLRHLTELLDEF